jgi:hypothetical protein
MVWLASMDVRTNCKEHHPKLICRLHPSPDPFPPRLRPCLRRSPQLRNLQHPILPFRQVPIILSRPRVSIRSLPQCLTLRNKNIPQLIRQEIWKTFVGVVHIREDVHCEQRASFGRGDDPGFPSWPRLRKLGFAGETCFCDAEGEVLESYHTHVVS